MPAVRLTARNIGSFEAPPRGAPPIDYYDEAAGSVPWFCLRVSPEGRRTFTVGYRVGRRRRRVRLGQFPTISLAEARQRARTVLAEVTRGRDPAADRDELKRADEFQGLVLHYVEAKAPNLSSKTLTEYRRMVSAYVQGTPLGRTSSRAIRRTDVRAWLEDIARKAPVMSNRVFQLVRATLRFAVREELLDSNPCAGLQRPRKEKERERVLGDDEIRILWRALDQASPQVAAAVKMLLLLGQRSTETLEMRWSDLDLGAEVPVWTIPGRFRKGHRLHVVPLAPFPTRILAALRAITGEKTRVFEGVSSANSERDWWGEIREWAMSNGLRERFTRHDLRSTCATGCSRLGAAESTVSRILGHAVVAGTVAVTARYDRFAHLSERAAALKAWASHIEGLVASAQEHRVGGAEVKRNSWVSEA
jgi:integrase